ncbi:MAG TPA: pyridoxamine 5'-phosphate oxidase [Chitinophagales bacterium]|jgi:pyridoxamine 5'-phosphate oxidase|nr:pyridoxamine 5'-phosphate oxidase [Chitinophagales bacterium]
MENIELHKMRENYDSSFLLEEHCNKNPFLQFKKWFEEAAQSNVIEPNAMTLATVGTDGQPSARIVLLKSFSKDGFTFYTNYESHKGQQLQENAKVALLFWWQERQVRIEGIAKKTDRESATEYFQSRPKSSQIGAWTSPQSTVLPSREALDNRYLEMEQKYNSEIVPMPDYWGGYLVIPNRIEFWQGRESRLHDRINYTLVEDENWKIERLAP